MASITKREHFPHKISRGEANSSWSFQEVDTYILKKQIFVFSEGCYIGCEGTFFICFKSPTILHIRKTYAKV
jgi:hypothetical protein